MRTVSPATADALQNAPNSGIKPRTLILFTAKELGTGVEVPFGFHTDIDTLAIDVRNGETGLDETHTYFGDGAVKSVSRIPLVVGLTVRRVTIELSNIHEQVNLMVRGHDVRNAKVQIHRGLRDPITNEWVDVADCHFMGTVTRADPQRPGVGGDGGISVDVAGIVTELTRTNPAKMADSFQVSRSSDRFFRYVDIMGDTKVVWGGPQPS